jgi:antitoxin (DNA-binding transcriptional repressor) of toxin-antitoxin stability system
MLTQSTLKVTLKDMERNLSAYLRRVQAGETLVIIQDGEPLAEVKPSMKSVTSLRPYALCTGEFSVPDDFDNSLPDALIKDFEGE